MIACCDDHLRLIDLQLSGGRLSQIEQPVRLNLPQRALGHVINRVHCAVSVYCWNITTLSP